MASVDLPRSLQDYFAFAETTPTRNGRRFSITLPYLRPDGRMDRLQWWYHLSLAKEMALGETAAETLRGEAVDRFITHIERWLHNTRQDMFGEGAIPYVSAEGNRVVAAVRIDPSLSGDLPLCTEEGSQTLVMSDHSYAEDATEQTEHRRTEAARRLDSKTAFG